MAPFNQGQKRLARPMTVGQQINVPGLPVVEAVAMKTAKLIEQGNALRIAAENIIVCRYIEPLSLTPNDIPLEMVWIPGGKFLMGSPEDESGRYNCEGPQHEVTVPGFFMSKHPITLAQWLAFEEMPSVNQDWAPDEYWDCTCPGNNFPMDSVYSLWLFKYLLCFRFSKGLRQNTLMAYHK